MPRITSAELRKLFPQDDAGLDVDHYVDDADALVTEVLGTSSFTAERLALITKYLAAHLYLLGQQEGGIFEEKIGEASEKRGSTFTLGQGMRLTRFGQMVLGLDTTGKFAALEGGKNRPALFRLV